MFDSWSLYADLLKKTDSPKKMGEFPFHLNIILNVMGECIRDQKKDYLNLIENALDSAVAALGRLDVSNSPPEDQGLFVYLSVELLKIHKAWKMASHGFYLLSSSWWNDLSEVARYLAAILAGIAATKIKNQESKAADNPKEKL